MVSSLTRATKEQSIWRELREGWPTLLACMIGLALGASILPYIAGVFVKSFESEFGWTRSQLSGMTLIISATVIPLAPVAGYMVDRWGVRLAVAIGMTALAAGFVAFGMMSGSFIEYLVIYLIVGALALLATSISFTRAINERFVSGRGLALGIALSGTGISAAIAPSMIAATIVEAGWRVAYFRLAVIVALAIPIIVVLLSLRARSAQRPRDVALTPCSDAPAKLSILTLLKDPLLLRWCATFFLLTMGLAGFTFHFIPMLADQGVTELQAAKLQAGLGIGLIAGRLCIGVAVDHFFAPRVAALALTFTAAGIIGLAMLGPSVAGLAVFAIGFSLGAEGDLIGYLTARYFGLHNYGQRYGIAFASYLLANGASPLMLSLLVDLSGGYRLPLLVCAAFVVAAIAMFATAPKFALPR